MPGPHTLPSDIAALLQQLQEEARLILGAQFLGLYLHGSLALGDFDPARSDIDFVVVTAGELSPATVDALAAMHARLAAAESKWGPELEGSYIPRRALRHYDLATAVHPHIERGGALRVEQHHSDWLIQRHILYEHGFALTGPPPQTLLEPAPPHVLRQAVLDLLWWWELQLEDTSRVENSGYQAYAILTMCRMLYTMQHGTIVSKPTAARWAQAHLEPRWRRLVDKALRWEPGAPLEALPETLAFIRYSLDQVRGASSWEDSF